MGLELKRIEKEIKLNKCNVCIQSDHLVRVVLVCVALYMRGFVTKAYIPMQHKTPHVGGLRWAIPPRREFCDGCTNMLVSKKPCGANANPNFCITPNANPQCEQVEYRSRWVPNARDWHWPCIFHVNCVHFLRVDHQTRTQFPVEYGL